MDRFSSRRTDPSAFRATWPRPAPMPRRAPSQVNPLVVCLVFRFDRFETEDRISIINNIFVLYDCISQRESSSFLEACIKDEYTDI